MTESQHDRITTCLSTVHTKKNELLSEARKLLRHNVDSMSKKTLDEVNREFNILFDKYKKLEMKEEYLEYSLMLDFVLQE